MFECALTLRLSAYGFDSSLLTSCVMPLFHRTTEREYRVILQYFEIISVDFQNGSVAEHTIVGMSRIPGARRNDTVIGFSFDGKTKWLLKICIPFSSFVLSLKEPHDIDEYFDTLLDMNIQEHLLFLNDFKQRRFGKNRSNGSGKAGQGKRGNSNKPGTKEKTPPAAEQSSPTKPNADSKKKPTKYVSLYAQDGTMNDVVLLKGRHLCDCQASKHKLINNCIQCGRIVCEQEGSGPCLFCGNLVCTEDEQRTIESSSKKGDNLKKSLMQQQRPKGWEEAVAMRNRLIDYDRTSERRTTVIDDESDYFKTNSVWLSDAERAKLKKLEEELNAKKHASRRSQKVTLDFAGRQIVDEANVTAEYEEQMLRQIADSQSNDNGMYAAHDGFGGSYDNMGLCHPMLSGPPPVVSHLC